MIIDVKGENDIRVVPPDEYVKHKKGEDIPCSPEEIDAADRIYRILGFIESLGGFSVLSESQAHILPMGEPERCNSSVVL